MASAARRARYSRTAVPTFIGHAAGAWMSQAVSCLLCALACELITPAMASADGVVIDSQGRVHSPPGARRQVARSPLAIRRAFERTLDDLEAEVDRMEAEPPSSRQLHAIEDDAREAWRRSTSADEAGRARRLLRRIARVAPSDRGAPRERRARQDDLGQDATREVTAGFEQVAQAPGELDCATLLPVAPAVPVYQPTGDPFLPMVPATPVAPVLVPAGLPPTRHFVSLDALGWWVRGDSLPPLVTTSPIGTPQNLAGVLGQADTTVLFGNQTVNGGIRPGGRVQGGVWIDPYQTWAVEGHYYALATQTANYYAHSVFSGGSTSDPILARPFFNDAPGVDAQSSVIVAFPNFILSPLIPPINVDGSAQIKETSNIQSAGGVVRWSPMMYTNPFRISFSGGYRFFALNETLTILAISTPPPITFPIPIPNGRIEVFDSFSTRNTFNGGEIGIAGELAGRTRWSLSADTRLALGNMHQVLTIDGRTSAISGPFVASYTGGLLAQPTNIGTFTQDRFALIPQVDVKLGFQATPAMRLTVGYNFTYISSVLRPGNQIDTTVNTTQIAGLPLVGPARPAAQMDTTGIWLQGITAGFDMRF